MAHSMRSLSGEELLQRPVRLRGIQLGRAVDLILDAAARRLLGFEVLCGDGEHRFLPVAAAEAFPDQIAVRSSLMLLNEEELDFYRQHGTTLTALRLDDPADVLLGHDWAVTGRVRGPGRDATGA
jgi:hypothetical protein